MELFEADYMSMNEQANVLNEKINELRMKIDYMKEVIDLVDITWEGDANIAFNVRMESDFCKLLKITDNIKGHIKALKDIIAMYQISEIDVMERVKEVRL